MSPKKVAKRKPKSKPVVQKQKQSQNTKVTVNLGTTAGKKAKPRAVKRPPARNVVQQQSPNVVTQYSQPTFMFNNPTSSSAPPPAISSSGGFAPRQIQTEGLGVPITMGDGELSVPAFGGVGETAEIGDRRRPIYTEPEPVINAVSFPEPTQEPVVVSPQTNTPPPPPTFASTLSGLANNAFGSALNSFINVPIRNARRPVLSASQIRDELPSSSRFLRPVLPASQISDELPSSSRFQRPIVKRRPVKIKIPASQVSKSTVGSTTTEDGSINFDDNSLSNQIFYANEALDNNTNNIPEEEVGSAIFSRGGFSYPSPIERNELEQQPIIQPTPVVVQSDQTKPKPRQTRDPFKLRLFSDNEESDSGRRSASGANIIPDDVIRLTRQPPLTEMRGRVPVVVSPIVSETAGRRMPPISETRPMMQTTSKLPRDLNSLQELANQYDIPTTKLSLTTGNRIKRTKAELASDIRTFL